MAFIDPYKNRGITLQDYARAGDRGEEAEEAASDAGVLRRSVDTVKGIYENVGIGGWRSIEGILDMVAGVVGGVGGLVSKDFQEGVRDVIEFDATDYLHSEIFNRAHRMLTGRDYSEHSYFDDDHIVNQVAQGVGGMLPAVAVTIATGGAGAPAAVSQTLSTATMATGAAGQATQEAYLDGAGYYQGLAYGGIRGGTEVVTEKMFGGLDAGLFGKGFLPDVAKSVADTGVKRFVKGALQEGAEEMVSELADPLTRSVYQGKEAYKKYLDPTFYKDVGEAGLVGTLTGAAFSGTVGRAMSGGAVAEDVQSVMTEVDTLERKRRNLFANDQLTDEADTRIGEDIRENYRVLEGVLKKAPESKRAAVMEQYELSRWFDEDGGLKPEFLARLDTRAASRQTATEVENGDPAGSTGLTGRFDRRYHDPDAEDASIDAALSRKGRAAFAGELSKEGKARYRSLKKVMNTFSRVSGDRLHFVIAEESPDTNAYYDPDTDVIVIGADVLEQSDDSARGVTRAWFEATLHEVTHATEGTAAYGELSEQLEKLAFMPQVYEQLAIRGYFDNVNNELGARLNALLSKESLTEAEQAEVGELSRKVKSALEERIQYLTAKDALTAEEEAELSRFLSESTAIMAERVLNSESFVRRLVREDAGLVEKLLIKIADIKEAMTRVGDKVERDVAKEIKAAEDQLLRAVSEAGYRFDGGKIAGAEDEEEKQESVKYSIKRPKFTQDDIQRNMEVIAGMDAVMTIGAEKLEKTGKRPKDMFLEFFESLGNNITSPIYGDIALSNASAKSEIRHGVTAEKIASIEAIPAVIEKGEVIFHRVKPDSDVERIVICAPIKIGVEDYYMGVMLQRDTQSQRLYLHSVASLSTKEEATASSQADRVTNGALEDDNHLFMTSILQKAVDVKQNLKNSSVKESRKPKSQTSGNSEKEKAPDWFTNRGLQLPKLVQTILDADNSIPENSENVKGDEENNSEKAEIIKYEPGMEGEVLPKPVLPFRKMLTEMLGTMVENDADYKILSDYAKSIDKLDVLQDRINELNMRRGELRDIQYHSPDAQERSEAAKALQELYKVRSELEEEMAEGDREIARLREMTPIKNLMRQAERKGKAKAEAKAREQIESKETTEGKRLLEKKLRHLYRRLFDPTKKWHIPPEMRDEVNAALAQTNMSPKWVTKVANLEAELDRLTRLKEKGVPNDKAIREIEAELEAAMAERETLSEQLAFGLRLFELFGLAKENAQSVNHAFDMEIQEKLYEYAGKVKDTPIHQMTLEQVEAANEFYQVLITRIGKANQLFLDGKTEELQDNGDRIMAEAKRAKAPGFLKPKRGESQARAWGRKFIWKQLKPLTATDLIGSKTLSRVFNGMMDGETTFAVDTEKARKYARSAFKKYHFNDWDLSKRTTIITANGKKMSLTIGEMMSLYSLWKRPAAQKHLAEGGIKYAVDATKKTKIKTDALLNDTRRFTFDGKTFDKIVKALTKEQRAFADEMQRYLADIGALGNEIALQMWGIELFDDPDYFPMEVDEGGKDSQTGKTGDPRLTNQSFTNRVNEKGATNPLVLRDFMDVWVNHVNSMNMFHAFAIPADNMNKVLNYRITAERDPDTGEWTGDAVKRLRADDLSVKDVLKSQYGDDAVKYIERLLRDINGGARADNAASILDKGLTSFKRASTLLSLSTIVQQPTSIARAMAYVNVKYFAGEKVLKTKGKDGKERGMTHEEAWKYIMEVAPVAVIKDMGGYDTGVGTRTQDYLKSKEYETLGEKLGGFFKDGDYRSEVFGRGAAFADELTWIGIFEACVREQADKLKVSVNSKPAMMMGAKRFAEVIRRTQVYDSTLTRTEIMRSKDTGAKMVTAFMSEPSTVVNMMIDGMVRASRGDGAFMVKTAGAVAASILLNSILVSLVYAMRDDDEDKSYGEKYWESLLWELVEGVNPAEYFPYLRDIMSLVKGYDVERSDMALIGQLIQNVQSITSESKTPYEKVMGVAGAVSSFFGLPVKNVERDARGLLNTVVGAIKKDPEEDIPDTVRREMNRLVIAGMDVLPRGVGDTVTYEGQSVKLTARQKAKFREVYGEANEAVSRMVTMKLYATATDEAKAKAIKRLYGIYYNRAIEDLLGVSIENKNVLMSRAVDPAQLSIIAAVCGGLTADIGADGKAVSGSKKAKVVAYLSSLNLKAAQKHLILGYLGYKNTLGEEKVRAYLAGLGLGQGEVEEMMRIGGY